MDANTVALLFEIAKLRLTTLVSVGAGYEGILVIAGEGIDLGGLGHHGHLLGGGLGLFPCLLVEGLHAGFLLLHLIDGYLCEVAPLALGNDG